MTRVARLHRPTPEERDQAQILRAAALIDDPQFDQDRYLADIGEENQKREDLQKMKRGHFQTLYEALEGEDLDFLRTPIEQSETRMIGTRKITMKFKVTMK